MQYMSKFEVLINFPGPVETEAAKGRQKTNMLPETCHLNKDQMENPPSTPPSGGTVLPFWEGTFIFLLPCAVTGGICSCLSYRPFQRTLGSLNLRQPRNCDSDQTLRSSVWQFPAHWWSSWVSNIPSTSEKKKKTLIDSKPGLKPKNNDTMYKIILIPQMRHVEWILLDSYGSFSLFFSHGSGIPTAAPITCSKMLYATITSHHHGTARLATD